MIVSLKNLLDCLGGGAWPFLVGGLGCLVYSVNERDRFSLIDGLIFCMLQSLFLICLPASRRFVEKLKNRIGLKIKI